MRPGNALATIGLILIAIGAAALAADPPRVRSATTSIPLYYVSYQTLPPGNYTLRQETTLNRSSFNVSLPTSGENITLRIGAANTSECRVEAYRLTIDGGGSVSYTNNSYINITVYEILPDDTTRMVPGASVSIPLKGGTLIPLTATTPCMGQGNEAEATRECPRGRAYYSIYGGGDRVNYSITVTRPDTDRLKVSFDMFRVVLDSDATGAVVSLEGDASGTLGIRVSITGDCVYRYHLDAPQYVPRVGVNNYYITDRYLDPGSLPVALALMNLGLALIVLGRR